jgi:hypothetical protein
MWSFRGRDRPLIDTTEGAAEMWQRLMLGAIVALVAIPAVATAKPGHGPAVKAAVHACQDERREIGREAFVEKYGRPAMRHCVREILPEARNAAQECRDERAENGVEAFREEHGVPSGARNAFGKCVSGKVAVQE